VAAHVVAVGVGNIGSHFVEHAARLPAVTRMTIVDPGTYEAKNVAAQRIDPADAGRAKVEVQAERIRRIDPELDVVAIAAPADDVPLGRLRGDVVVAGLDNRRARQTVNEVARRLGVPWLDAGVRAQGSLVRVNLYGPGEDSACIECGWGDRDYDGLEQIRPCSPDAEVPPTNASAGLGALAAAVQAMECEKLLRGDRSALEGHQLLVDVAHHVHHLTSFGRNPACRLFDHGPWNIERLAFGGAGTLGELVETTAPEASTLEVFGRRFVRLRVCRDCGRRDSSLRIAGSRPATVPRCPSCGGETMPSGFHAVEALDLASLADRDRALPIGELGVRDADVLTLSSGSTPLRRVEISFDGAAGREVP